MENQSYDRPLIIQSDKTLLLEVHSPSFNEARNDIIAFAELVKSPEHIHTFSVTPISLWNAASAGVDAQEIIRRLLVWSKYDLPETVSFYIDDIISRFGAIELHPVEDDTDQFYLEVKDPKITQEILHRAPLMEMLTPRRDGYYLHAYDRGNVKLQLIKLGYPVDDRIPLHVGDPMPFSLRETSVSGYPFVIRDYQKEAKDAVLGDLGPGTGYGTIVLPCGSGKTVVGISVMQALQTHTLILTTNVAAVHQWINELIDKTSLTRDDIGEYSGDKKIIRPVTVCTYQILTWRKDKNSDFLHFSIFKDYNWGLVLYDEVHTLPAPVFKVTAEIQSMYRVGLTATLVREDNREDEVFSLVGPKRYDIPWRELEQKGWIAEAHCYEIRIPLDESLDLDYAIGSKRDKFRISSENPLKKPVIKQLMLNHPDDYILIIGQYLTQLKELAKELDLPLITGSTPNKRRDELFTAFRDGKQKILVVSKVANFAIDLPDASVAIQISGTFGSRQEEAQRLGRILRPKEQGSYFYSLVTRYTVEEEFASNRQKFLTEQGYKYHIEIWD
ncbi:MAG: DEAD/DEAH box helicase [Spirochaetia bacterium]|nr:DEAD/DEAH box helicase [Spirochaetia bacterium]